MPVSKNKFVRKDKVEKYLNENKAAYDNLAKRVLSRKIILAHILKETVTEFVECSVEEIVTFDIISAAIVPTISEKIKIIVNI